MRIKPNKSVLEGTVRRIERAPDGFGAQVEFKVAKSAPAEGYEDFLGAKPGSTLTIFAAVPEDVVEGEDYQLTTSVLAGPRGQRVVLEAARAIRPSPSPTRSRSAS